GLAALLAIASVVAGRADSTQQPPRFSTRVESVRVDVLVTDHGHPIRGLAARDFEIFDNGVRQQLDFVSFEQIPIDVILALDMSDSVAGERLDHLRAAGDAALAALEHDDRAALVTFSHVVDSAATLSTDVAHVRRALQQAEGSGETSLVDGTFAGILV